MASDRDIAVERKNIADMTVDEVDDLLAEIRSRRARLAVAYKEAQKAKAGLRLDKAREDLARQLRMFDKELAQFDRVIAKLEKRALNIRALRLEIE